jgi:hypothetical protein
VHYRKLFENEFAGAWDLTDDDDQPVDKTVTIERIGKTEVPSRRTGGTETKPVLYFKNAKKGMITNVTNCQTIANMYGLDVHDWIGKRITLYQAMTSTPEGEKACIRIRPTPPKAADQKGGKKAKPEREPGSDDE